MITIEQNYVFFSSSQCCTQLQILCITLYLFYAYYSKLHVAIRKNLPISFSKFQEQSVLFLMGGQKFLGKVSPIGGYSLKETWEGGYQQKQKIVETSLNKNNFIHSLISFSCLLFQIACHHYEIPSNFNF